MVAETRDRDRRANETRARIAEVALDLFVRQGYAETTIDQIAAAAHVGRRTVFRHFASKEAMLFDHLVVRREVALRLLRERPESEPALVSLHAVLRELCVEGYDRRLLAQIRAVLATQPRFAAEQLSVGIREFTKGIVSTLENRRGDEHSTLEIRALTLMAMGWFVAAAHVYLVEGRPSLVECFDEVVATCIHSSVRDLSPSLQEPLTPYGAEGIPWRRTASAISP